jgi:hypothetical protein
MKENISQKKFCNRCKGYTNQIVIFQKRIEHEDYEPEYFYNNYGEVYKVFECAGCNQVSFGYEYHDYMDTFHGLNGDLNYSVITDYFPQHFSFQELYGSQLLPKSIKAIYDETITALKNKCYLLSAAGFRAIIEAICLNNSISGKTLENKIDKLKSNMLITQKEAARLHAVRFLGNDSLHQIIIPSESTLLGVLNIIQHLLNNLYIIDNTATSELDTYITDYADFEKLLTNKIFTLPNGMERPLVGYLDRSVRRVKQNLPQFESKLIENINSGKFEYLSLGEIKKIGNSEKPIQHFINSFKAYDGVIL